MPPQVFTKRAPADQVGQPLYEAAGLRWLAAGGARTPRVVKVDASTLITSHVDSGPPSATAARLLGHMLAETHASGAPGFGVGPPGHAGNGWMGMAPLPLTGDPRRFSSWGSFYSELRLRPYISSVFTTPERDALEELCGALEAGLLDHPQPALVRESEGEARLHGDLWFGNILWSRGGPTLVDPAAQGGHAETDLATLRTFSTPYADEIVRGYQEASTLAEGWDARLGLHQTHILVVHCYLFGRSYVPTTMRAVSSALWLL